MKGKILLAENIEKRNFQRAGEASSKLKDILRKLGLNSKLIRRTSIITYELEMNVIIHSEGGFIEVSIKREEITVIVKDKGPGIKDLKKAFQPGYSTASDEIRKLGFGAGMGLNNVQSYSDKLNIKTESGKGTTIEAKIKIER